MVSSKDEATDHALSDEPMLLRAAIHWIAKEVPLSDQEAADIMVLWTEGQIGNLAQAYLSAHERAARLEAVLQRRTRERDRLARWVFDKYAGMHHAITNKQRTERAIRDMLYHMNNDKVYMDPQELLDALAAHDAEQEKP